jgi:hypothetical protein
MSMGSLVLLSFTVPFLLLVIGFLVFAAKQQQTGLARQQRAMAQVEESLALSRRAVALHETANAHRLEMLALQREILELLQRFAALSTASADQPTSETGIRPSRG